MLAGVIPRRKACAALNDGSGDMRGKAVSVSVAACLPISTSRSSIATPLFLCNLTRDCPTTSQPPDGWGNMTWLPVQSLPAIPLTLLVYANPNRLCQSALDCRLSVASCERERAVGGATRAAGDLRVRGMR